MPHFIIEYSANIEEELDIDRMVRTIHDAANESRLFDPAAIRTRAERRDHYILADGNPANGFVHITARIQSGRDAATKHKLAGDVLAVAKAYLAPLYARRPMALNVEVEEVSEFSVRYRTIGVKQAETAD